MSKVAISVNISAFLDLVNSISRFVPGARLIINAEGVVANFRADNARFKVVSSAAKLLETQNEKELLLNLSNLDKFYQILTAVKSAENTTDIITCNVSATKIEFNGNNSDFNYSLARSETIDKFIDVDIKANLLPLCVITTQRSTLKELINNTSAVSDSSTIRIILDAANTVTKTVRATVTDPENEYANKFSRVIGLKDSGEYPRLILSPSTLQHCMKFALTGQDQEVNITFTDKNSLMLNMQDAATKWTMHFAPLVR